MTTGAESTGTSPAASPAAPVAVSAASPGWRWRRPALFLAGAAQLITISDLLGADPVAVTWSSLLLAVAPVLLAAVAAFGPTPVNLAAAAAGVVVLVARIAGQITHTGVLFAPALVTLAVGGVKLWREQAASESR